MPELLQRLLQRKLIQWCLGYLAGAWALLQVIDFVANQFGWPAQVSRIALAMLGIGFMVVAVLAWYHGDQGSQRVTVPETIMIGSLLIVAVAAVALASRDVGQRQNATGALTDSIAPIEQRSLAVLPFANVGEDQANEYFSDGITEEILNTVARLPGLRVASRTSSFSFKGQNTPLDQIAERLRVAHVLEGSVRRFEQKVVISAQLIDAGSDRRIWSQDFNRDLSDVYAVQQEIARAIARALQLQLGSGLRQHRPTLNSQAHDSYLLGLREWHQRTRRGVAQSIAHFQAALREDSLYANAWAGLALAYSINPIYDFRARTPEVARLALQASRRALALDTTLTEPHAAMGQVLFRFEWKWKEGEEELRRAIAMNPNDALAPSFLASCLVFLGRSAEALELADRAADLDPLSVYVRQIRGIVLYFMDRKEEALAEFRRARSLEPNVYTPLGFIVRIHLSESQYDSAKAALQRIAELDGLSSPQVGVEYIEALRARQFARARSIVAGWERASAYSYYNLAFYYHAAHDREAAIRMLTQSFHKREANVINIGMDPNMAALREDPRVISILRRIGLR